MKSEYEIVQELNAAREDRERERLIRVTKLEHDCPEYAVLVTERNAVLAEAAIAELLHKHDLYEKHVERARNLDKREMEILKELGLPENYLETWYSCPHCNDRGFTPEGEMCECLKKRIRTERFRAYDLNEQTKKDNFDNYNLEIFSDEPEKDINISARHLNEINLRKAKSYCDNYGPESGSLILSGPPGTGKTYLISCIVNELLDRDVDLIYISAHNLVQLLYDDLNGKKTYQQSYRAAFKNVELLIIDDLGAEVDSDFTRSAFSEIVDERLVNDKKTIISTNYELKTEIVERYPERMASRLLGRYEKLMFLGKDLRQKHS